MGWKAATPGPRLHDANPDRGLNCPRIPTLAERTGKVRHQHMPVAQVMAAIVKKTAIIKIAGNGPPTAKDQPPIRTGFCFPA